MDVVSKGDEELPASTSIGDTHCVCWSPKRSEEVCRCNYTKGHAIRDICSRDMKEKTRSSGLQNQNILGRRVLIQQLKELLHRSDLILQNSHRLQMLSQDLVQTSLRLQDLCVIAGDSMSMTEEIENMTEGNGFMPQQNDSLTGHYTAIVQDNGSMTEETSLGSRSG